MYSALNTLSEYIYLYISKNITSYTFLLVFKIPQKQPPEMLYKKIVLKNFAKITGKHLCQSLFFNNVAGSRLRGPRVKKETLAQV